MADTQYTEMIRDSIIRDMAEGVMMIDFDGIISGLNRSAQKILNRSVEQLVGQRFVRCFFEYQENDTFIQAILDAVYDANVSHVNVVSYFNGERTLQLRVTTSYLRESGKRIGVIVVLTDISELSELRDAVKAMERIKALNMQLELRNKLLSETFGRFLSDEIVRNLLETPDGLMLGGKKRTLTVMMSDLRGFTAISEHMEAGSLLTMLNHYLGEMTEIIQKNNGTIIEFIGDGIMAIFGAPVATDWHAADAVAAAVGMQCRMKEINRWNMENGFPTLQMGIGLNTGEVIVGNIGSEKRTKYGVVGTHVNLCGRIESYTVGGQILISPLTREMVGVPLQIEREEVVFPKGVKQALTLSLVSGIGAPYNLQCEVEQKIPDRIKTPVSVSYVIIHGKHCSGVMEEGLLTALDKNMAIMNTENKLAPFNNIRIDIGEDVFAKVLRREGDGWLICFTSVPLSFHDWVLVHADA
ncbi:MAG: adenylate/guanylate cyclase domain-containing protein [Christensenellales bacterium]|nr:adenylate/guanylate cyclase domain-containing protein [Christensenellales bacterium]